MTKKPFDVNERDRLRFAYLKAIYNKEQKEKTSLGTIVSMHMKETADAVHITEVQAERIMLDLENAGFIQLLGGLFCGLTDMGRETVENELHEQHRSWHDRLREKLGSPTVMGGLAGLITSLLVNVLAASDMPWWLKLLLGKK
jgi:Mn-dependent DtxR family transcriptional regulator